MVDRVSCRGIIMEWEELLVVKLNPDDTYYCLPWGTLEKYEQLDTCIVREMKEELGVIPTIWNILFIHEVVLPNKLHLLEFFYKIENPEEYRSIDLKNASHAFEIHEVKRVNIFDQNVVFLPGWLLEKLRKGFWIQSPITQVITSL